MYNFKVLGQLDNRRVWIILVVALLTFFPQMAKAAEPAFSIRLVDGSVGYGDLLASPHDGQLAFHVQGFAQAFRFEPNHVHSVRRLQWLRKENPLEQSSTSSLLFSLRGREQVVGNIISMNDSQFVIESEHLGTLALLRADVQRISKAPSSGRNIKSVFDANDWQDPNNLGLWDITALRLSTHQAGSRILTNYEMPEQAELKISLQWTSKPRFSIALGVDPKKKNNQLNQQWGVAQGQKPPPTTGRFVSFASLEVWDNALILVRESVKHGKFAYLSNLEGQSGCDLSVYLDLKSGVAAVQSFDGKLHRLEVDPKELARSLKAVSLQNFGPSLSVERLELNTWDGQLPLEYAASKSVVIKQDDTAVDGFIDGWDAASANWIVRTATDQLSIPRADLKLANFSLAEKTTEAAAEVTPQSDSQTAQPEAPNGAIGSQAELAVAEQQPTRIDLILQDGSRLKGQLFASEKGTINFQPLIGPEPRLIQIEHVSELTAYTAQQAVVKERSNKLAAVGLSQIRGEFLESTPEGSSTALLWQPTIGLNASELDYTFSGEIRLEAPPKAASNTATADVDRTQPPQMAPRNLNIFQQIFGGAVARPVRAAAEVKTVEEKKQASTTVSTVSTDSQIRFRSGDVAPATILRITDEGIKFESNRTSTTFAPNKAIDQVFFRASKSSKLTDDERKRLLTVPRAQKNDPPTHLIISIAGDFLRGHLVEVTPQKTAVEVRGEIMELSTEELSEIVWLYERKWATAEPKEPSADASTAEPSEESAQAVHVVVGNDQGLTLLPKTVQAGVLIGNSEILGESTVKLAELTQLFFGPDTSLKARQRRNETYELSLAQLPKEQASSEDGGVSPTARHPLAGKPAPEFSLKNLSGKSFRLADQRGQIIVLDFWASWCGPCMQAMPQLDQLIEEFSNEKVHLIAVNIQETKPRIELALERLKIECEVLMDAEGETAAAYKANAIPQTVIIDKSGDVADVIVGGGANALDQIRQAIVGLLLKENDPIRAN